MRTIQLNISLEDYCSRLPGVIPAYEGNNLYYFDTASIESDNFKHKSNYGMYPVNLVFSGINVTTKYDNWALSCVTDDFSSGYGIASYDASIEDYCSGYTTLSWNHISDIFAFFRNYYALLNDYSSCGLAYSSATDYYITESNNKYSPNLMWGNDEETYTAFDHDFERYGGCVSAITASDVHEDYKEAYGYVHEPIVHSFDKGFFKWLCDNVVPAFFVPSAYTEAYDSRLLFYPDAVSWRGWLYKMSQKYDDTKDCLEYATDDLEDTTCCECEDYKLHGGTTMLKLLDEWITSINETIQTNNERISGNTSGDCQAPVIFQDITLLNSTEDLGELSILPEEWEELENYASLLSDEYSIDYLSANTESQIGIGSGGTVVIKNDKPYIINIKNITTSGVNTPLDSGYKYDDRYCECIWGNNSALTYDSASEKYDTNSNTQWADYSEAYLNAFRDVFSASVSSYTYNEKGRFVGNPTPLKMAQEYTINTNSGLGYIYYQGGLYAIYENECIAYTLNDNPYLCGKIFIVNREEGTYTPYIEVNKKKIYATFQNNGKYAFYFNQNVEFDKLRLNEKSFKQFVSINGKIYPVNNRRISYTLDVYHQVFSQVDGYFSYNDEDIYIINSGITSGIVSPIQNVSGSDITNTFNVNSNWENCDISGLTIDSILKDIKYYEINDSGNSVCVTSFYDEHPMNYITGVCMSKLQSLESENLYYDDLGNKMDGYYNASTDAWYAQPTEGEWLEPYYNVGTATSKKESFTSGSTTYYVGNIIESMTFYYCNIDGTKNNRYVQECTLTNLTSSLNAIQDLIAMDIDSGDTLDDTIYCDIKYDMGATIYHKGHGKWNLCPNTHKGVEYYETVSFIPYQEQFYLSSASSYNVQCYVLGQQTNIFDSSDYNISVESPSAMFRMQILTLCDELDKNVFKTDYGFENNNGLTVMSVFRQEYMLNVSQPEYVETNVNIDRGVNSAFEKHIKLGEITSFEALENYGNGFFNMLDT